MKNSGSQNEIISSNPRMLEIMNLAKKIANLSTPVLITGESGCGKELLARYIHSAGNSASSPFVGLNCASIPPNLMESEFFGYEAGAFTGAHVAKEGLFECADNGTLFLDEVGEMPLSLQVKLLRAIQEGETRRLGSTRNQAFNVRIISATNSDLEEYIKQGMFREDLFFRIGVFVLDIPPLRERRDDIPILVSSFTEYFAKEQNRSLPHISSEAMNFLCSHNWPGNIRELENVMERALIFCGDTIKREDLQLKGSSEINENEQMLSSLAEISQIAQQNAESTAILKALSQTGGNKTRAAELLSVSYKTLLNKIKQYSIGG